MNLSEGGYDHIVSLGCACDTAYNLQRVVAGVQSHLFDWVLTSDDGLLLEIGRDPAPHFDLAKLKPNHKGQMTDEVTGTRFVHEFKDLDQPRKVFVHQSRITFLKERWRGLMAGTGHVLFVRKHGKNPDPAATANRLLAALWAAAPALQIDLLYLAPDASLASCANAPGLIFRARPTKEPDNWKGFVSEWDVALAGIRKSAHATSATQTAPTHAQPAPDSPLQSPSS